MPVQKCAAALPRRIEFGGERMIDDAEHQLAGDDETDGDAPEGYAGQEIVRAVDRIDDPEGICVEVAGPALLAQGNRRAGKSFPKSLDDQVLAGAIGLADEVLRALAMDGEKLAPGEVIGGDAARFAHDRFRHAQPVIEIGRFHATHELSPAFPARSTSCAMNGTSSPEIVSISPSAIHSTRFGSGSRPPRQYSTRCSGRGM